MKQCIDSKQLKELSYKQFIELAKIVNSYSKDTSKEEWESHIKKEHLTMHITMLERTNIGKMIEILEESSYQFKISKVLDSVLERFEHWSLYVSYVGIDDMQEIEINEYELCDALFKGLKIVL